MTAPPRQTIALAGAGNLGRYVCEELLTSPLFTVAILTRSTKNKWFFALPSHPHLSIHTTDYSLPSLLSILNTTRATTLLSFIADATPAYLSTHSTLLTACRQSTHCKRLIPSEYVGDIEAYPAKPDYYATTRLPFREVLRAQSEVEWTLVCCGWLMDYFLPERKSYMAPVKGKFPVDADAWTACLRGSGDEAQSWTCARDVARAVKRLCEVERGGWESGTFVVGGWGTFRGAVGVMEGFYGRAMEKTYKSLEEIKECLEKHAGEAELSEEMEMAQVEEMMVMGYLACPVEKALRQRQKYFKGIDFMDLKDFLEYAETRDLV